MITGLCLSNDTTFIYKQNSGYTSPTSTQIFLESIFNVYGKDGSIIIEFIFTDYTYWCGNPDMKIEIIDYNTHELLFKQDCFDLPRWSSIRIKQGHYLVKVSVIKSHKTQIYILDIY